MNVAVTVNDTYVYPLYIMLQTLFAHHGQTEVHVWLIHNSVSGENIDRLRTICEKNHNRLTVIHVEDELFESAPRLHFRKEMYFRIMLSELIPETEDRILYLDPDLIVLDSLTEFYHTPMEGYCLAGCRDRLQDRERPEYREFLGLKKETHYVNSGVLLFHLAELRKCFKTETVDRMIQERGSGFCFPDQDIINLLFEGRIKLMDDRYNLNPNHLYATEFLKYNLGIGRSIKPAILHYMGAKKPWNKFYFKNLYQYYWYCEIRYTCRPKARICLRALQILPSMIIGAFDYVRMLWRRIGKGKE